MTYNLKFRFRNAKSISSGNLSIHTETWMGSE